VRGASPLHGDAGPLAISDGPPPGPVAEAWIAAALRAGIARNDDFNGVEQEGVGRYQLTQRDGRRWSAYSAYLHDHLQRPNLTLLTGRQATRLVLEGTRVCGVEVEVGETREILRAGREVIVCAGAYNSPQLLLLSGIGPREQLASLGIETVADLPVGEGLQDHPGVPLVLSSGDTPLGAPTTGVEAGGFLRTRDDLDECDIQVFANAWPFLGDARTAATVNGFTVAVELLRPASTGHVRLRSTEPTAKPLITHDHFADARDLAPMRLGLRKMMELLRLSPLAELDRGKLRWPEATDDAGLDDYLRANALSFFHPSSTCAMGPVLDAELRVRGIDGLRVADASSFPTTIRGNPNAACMMLGEKAADLLAGVAA
jgi:choline dehydrogenase